MMDLEKTEKTDFRDRIPEKNGQENDVDIPSSGLRIVWRTDIGRIRKTNQDAVIVGSGLAGVADGMGGHNAGEIASGGLRDGLVAEIKGKEPDPDLLAKTIQEINSRLFEQQENDMALSGMGTTLTVMWPAKDEMIIAQVGDSRAYLLRNHEIRQITEDHSIVADMVRKGVLTEEQAQCHPMRNYITRAVGTDDTVEVDMYIEKRCHGDRWLICSDGLYGLISRDTLLEYLLMDDPNMAADRLLQAALDNGGKDNISLVIVDDSRSESAECIQEVTGSQEEEIHE